MKKEIFLKLEIDLDEWEGYEDVDEELIVEDAFEFYKPKEGTNLTISKVEWLFPEHRQDNPVLYIVDSNLYKNIPSKGSSEADQ